MPYLNVVEVESGLASAVQPPYAGIAQLIVLPNLTWEGRTAHALKLAAGSAMGRPGILLLGGVHAREWGSPDILLFFIEQLEEAYVGASGITLGAKTFTAAQIASVVNGLDLYVFPQVNPDGRNRSLTTDAFWRKNLRPAPASAPACPGVDLNRNYDFLWNFPSYFSPASAVRSSTDPCDETYIGPTAGSEPETANVVWLMDSHPNIRALLDLHSFSEDILYLWGDDDDQSTDPNMTFTNVAYNLQRGVANDTTYREFLASCDQSAVVALATRMHDGIAAVRGKNYTVEQALKLYPTSGTGHDYSFARHVVDRAKSKAYGYTIEWGTEFQPTYAEMQNIISDITAGLIEFCLAFVETNADVYIRDSAADTGALPSVGAFWDSPDIVVRQSDDGVMTYEPAKRGQTNYIYVRVTNRGPAAAAAVDVTLRAVRYPGTEFVYPLDWTAVDADHLLPTPMVTSWGGLAPGASALAKFSLSAAQVDALWGWEGAHYHPCLLAQAVGCDDYAAAVGVHVWESNNLGQKNISVVDATIDSDVVFPFMVGSPMNREKVLEILIDRSRLPSSFAITAHAGAGSAAMVPHTRWRLEEIAPLTLADAAGESLDNRVGMAIVEPRRTLRLHRLARSRQPLALRIHVPAGAAPGRYPVEITQRDGAGHTVGGVTVVLRVKKGR